MEPRILIVETDDAVRQKLYRSMLDLELFSDCASNAREAIGFLAQRRYSIVILDANVTGGSESVIAATQRIPNGERPIILATAESDHLGRFDAEGVQVVIRRPLRVRDVAGLARACIDASGRRKPRKADTTREDELRAQ